MPKKYSSWTIIIIGLFSFNSSQYLPKMYSSWTLDSIYPDQKFRSKYLFTHTKRSVVGPKMYSSWTIFRIRRIELFTKRVSVPTKNVQLLDKPSQYQVYCFLQRLSTYLPIRNEVQLGQKCIALGHVILHFINYQALTRLKIAKIVKIMQNVKNQ